MNDNLKRATWLELFYDLAFVALIAQLTYLVADHHSTLTDWITILLVGYLINNAWWGTTANRNLQDSEGTTDRILVQLQMVGAFLMSLTMPDVFVGDWTRFFTIYALVRGLQVVMIMRMYRLYPDDAPQTKNVLQGIAIAAIGWCIVGFMPFPYAFVLAFALLTLEIVVPLSTGRGNQVRLLNVNHLQERLGLFLMLVIGESMLVVALANTAASIDLARPVIVLSGLGLMIGLWWLYFGYLERCGEGVRPRNLFVYIQAHAFLFGGVVLMAAAYKNMLKHNLPTTTDLLLLGAGYVLMMVMIVLIRKMLHGLSRTKAVITLGFCIGVLVVIGAGVYLDAALMAVLVLTFITLGIAAIDHAKASLRR